VPGLADESDSEVTERGHDARSEPVLTREESSRNVTSRTQWTSTGTMYWIGRFGEYAPVISTDGCRSGICRSGMRETALGQTCSVWVDVGNAADGASEADGAEPV
jgi:hypothetical protein